MGGRIMEALSGVQEAGLVGLFSTVSGTIQRLMQSTAGEDDTGLVGRIIGSRAVIGQAIADIQQYGRVTDSTLSAIQQSLVNLPPVAADYVQAMIRLYQANQAVTAAQERLNDVTKEYDDQLDPLREELDDLRDVEANAADAKRIAALRQAIARGALNEEQKAQALREIRARELAMQIRQLEDEKETAVDSAQAQLDAAEAEQQAAEEAVALQQALIDAQLESNGLIQEQISLLDRLAETMTAVGAGIGDAIGDALGGAGGGLAAAIGEGLGGLGDEIDLGDGLDLTSLFEEMDIEGLVAEITAEFEPLKTEVTTLGDLFGTIGTRWDEITEKSNPLMEAAIGVGIAFASIKLGGLVAGLLSTAGGFLTAAGASGTLGATLLALAGPVGVIIAVIAGLALAVATDFLGIRTASEQLVQIIEYGFWKMLNTASIAATQLGAVVKFKFFELLNNASITSTQLGHIIEYGFWWVVNTASTAATQLVAIVLYKFMELLNNASMAGTQLVEIVRIAFFWVLNKASTAATQLVAMVVLKWLQIIAKTETLKESVKEKAQVIIDWFVGIGDKATSMADVIETAVGRAKDFVTGLWDAIKGFWEWLKDKVFNFDINLPSLPDWATPWQHLCLCTRPGRNSPTR
jgi:hypothetical protein